MELTTHATLSCWFFALFMMSKIQNLNGTHNSYQIKALSLHVVYDVKDTKFEWNSQHSNSEENDNIGCL